MIASSDVGIIKLFKYSKGSFELVKTIEAHSQSILQCEFSMDDSQFITVSNDKQIKVWTSKKGKCVKTIEKHTASVYN
jgi:WD40 repeat protein